MPPISRYPIPALQDLPDDLRERILAVQEKAGFVPNVSSLHTIRDSAFLRLHQMHLRSWL